MKHEIFNDEIVLIQAMDIRQFTIDSLNNAPDYFFEAPASSTGKYHPQCTLGKGGLVVHTKRVVFFANRVCDGWGIVAGPRDIVLSASILHDIAKTGRGAGSFENYENHPINAIKYLASLNTEPTKERIVNCIKFHMGRWTPASIKKNLEDYTILEFAMTTADFLAATKDVTTPKDL
jgi:23S rRNA maturation-related 3'-5' exoribonuclease YhaM